jgi:hypothetical protein
MGAAVAGRQSRAANELIASNAFRGLVAEAYGLPHSLYVIQRSRTTMSERNKTHNGRDVDGRFRVRQADVEDLLEDPNGTEFVRDDVRLGGAVADTGPHAADQAKEIGELIATNREDVDRVTGKSDNRTKRGKKK